MTDTSQRIAEYIGATAEVVGHELSDTALEIMVRDLQRYEAGSVISALERCARECKYKLTLADIIERLDDGRPTPEEAWNTVDFDERATNVWTAEMSAAFFVALESIENRDRIGARMAFLEVYRRKVAEARAAGQPVEWLVSLGHDKEGRLTAIRDALDKQRITVEQARHYLPHLTDEELESGQLLPAGTAAGLLLQSPKNDAA